MQYNNEDHLFQDCVVNINGELTDAKQAKISVLDRGFLYGDSIYEVTYSENNTLLFVNEHMQRLLNSARLLHMELEQSIEFYIQEMLRTLKHAQIPRAYIRLIITRGISPIGLDPFHTLGGQYVIIAKPLPEYPHDMYTKGLKMMISQVQRNPKEATDPNAKSGNYLNNVMAIREAKSKGYFDALMANSQGDITEGTTFNVWMVKDKTLYTPHSNSGLLKGITRSKVMQLCKENNIAFQEANLKAADFHKADEVFLTSATKGVMSINQIDDIVYGKSIADWPMTRRLAELYSQLLKEEEINSPYKY